MAGSEKSSKRGAGWPSPGGSGVIAGSALPSYTGLYGGTTDAFLGQNGYAGTGVISGAQFGGSSDAGSMAGAAGGDGGDAGGGTTAT